MQIIWLRIKLYIKGLFTKESKNDVMYIYEEDE